MRWKCQEAGGGSLLFSGCGDIKTPLKTAPPWRRLKPGTAVLLNGAPGLVLGEGTKEQPHETKPSCSAGTLGDEPLSTSAASGQRQAEVFNTVAVPIPVTGERVLENLLVMNSDIKLPVADIRDRSRILGEITYGDVWVGDERPSYSPERCGDCLRCTVAMSCPTHKPGVDAEKCFGWRHVRIILSQRL